MGSTVNSGQANGNQMSLEEQESKLIAKDNEQRIINCILEDKNYDRYVIGKRSPIPIPDDAKIVAQRKASGYLQVAFKWSDGDYRYNSRWHTKTPNAPDDMVTWRVTRRKKGRGYGPQAHEKGEQETLIRTSSGAVWISDKRWTEAIQHRNNGTATEEDKELLKNGHWPDQSR